MLLTACVMSFIRISRSSTPASPSKDTTAVQSICVCARRPVLLAAVMADMVAEGVATFLPPRRDGRRFNLARPSVPSLRNTVSIVIVHVVAADAENTKARVLDRKSICEQSTQYGKKCEPWPTSRIIESLAPYIDLRAYTKDCPTGDVRSRCKTNSISNSVTVGGNMTCASARGCSTVLIGLRLVSRKTMP